MSEEQQVPYTPLAGEPTPPSSQQVPYNQSNDTDQTAIASTPLKEDAEDDKRNKLISSNPQQNNPQASSHCARFSSNINQFWNKYIRPESPGDRRWLKYFFCTTLATAALEEIIRNSVKSADPEAYAKLADGSKDFFKSVYESLDSNAISAGLLIGVGVIFLGFGLDYLFDKYDAAKEAYNQRQATGAMPVNPIQNQGNTNIEEAKSPAIMSASTTS